MEGNGLGATKEGKEWRLGLRECDRECEKDSEWCELGESSPSSTVTTGTTVVADKDLKFEFEFEFELLFDILGSVCAAMTGLFAPSIAIMGLGDTRTSFPTFRFFDSSVSVSALFFILLPPLSPPPPPPLLLLLLAFLCLKEIAVLVGVVGTLDTLKLLLETAFDEVGVDTIEKWKSSILVVPLSLPLNCSLSLETEKAEANVGIETIRRGGLPSGIGIIDEGADADAADNDNDNDDADTCTWPCGTIMSR